MIKIDILGFIVGVAGLILTIMTLIQAKSAKEAAQDAVEYVSRIDGAMEFSAMEELAEKLLDHVQARNPELAYSRAKTLLRSLRAASGGARQRGDIDTVDRLRLPIDKLSEITQGLSAKGISSKPKDHTELLGNCVQVLNAISEELGISKERTRP